MQMCIVVMKIYQLEWNVIFFLKNKSLNKVKKIKTRKWTCYLFKFSPYFLLILLVFLWWKQPLNFLELSCTLQHARSFCFSLYRNFTSCLSMVQFFHLFHRYLSTYHKEERRRQCSWSETIDRTTLNTSHAHPIRL